MLQGGEDDPGRKDTNQNEGKTTARLETAESTQKQRADDERQETVTKIVNYMEATTWRNSASGRDAVKEFDTGTISLFPQPEDT